MIYLGLHPPAKIRAIEEYIAAHSVKSVVVISPERFFFDWSPPSGEWLEWRQVIEYKPFYRLLQEIDQRTLVVINECLRKQNRYDLTYNCIRHYLNQAGHQLIFQYLPIIDGRDDFMVLYDFDTQSRWKRTKFDHADFNEASIQVNRASPEFIPVDATATAQERLAYARKREQLFKGLGAKDPHTLPRNLYLQTGKIRLRSIDAGKQYIGRNNRFTLPNLSTYREFVAGPVHGVFELPHNHIDFNDFAYLSGVHALDVLRADLPVDHFYWNRYQDWLKELDYAYAAIQQD